MASVIRGSGTSSLGGDLDIEGVLTYEDVASVDSVGIITARSGIDVGTGTSISSPSSNTLTLGTNNEERFRITSAGNVGVNTTTFPANGTNLKVSDGTISRLVLDKTGTNARQFEIGNLGTGLNIYDLTADAERLRITSGGDLGLGVSGGMDQAGTLYIVGGQGVRWTHPTDGTLYGDHYVSSGGAHVFRSGASLTEKLRIDSNAVGLSTFLVGGQTTPVEGTNTTAHIQSASQIIAVQGVLTRNGGWSMLPTTRVTLTTASGGISGHTVQIDLAGLNGANHSTMLRVSFAMRRGNTGSAFSQKSEYMGLWHATKISSDEHIDQSHIVTREMTVVSANYASNVITFTFNTDNVRSFTARAFEYCTTGALYTDAL